MRAAVALEPLAQVWQVVWPPLRSGGHRSSGVEYFVHYNTNACALEPPPPPGGESQLLWEEQVDPRVCLRPFVIGPL